MEKTMSKPLFSTRSQGCRPDTYSRLIRCFCRPNLAVPRVYGVSVSRTMSSSVLRHSSRNHEATVFRYSSFHEVGRPELECFKINMFVHLYKNVNALCAKFEIRQLGLGIFLLLYQTSALVHSNTARKRRCAASRTATLAGWPMIHSRLDGAVTSSKKFTIRQTPTH